MSDSEIRGKKASVDGFAHEHIVVGILMKKYQNVSLVDLPLSPYDIIIELLSKYCYKAFAKITITYSVNI